MSERLWCPCFQSWQPVQSEDEPCPAGGCQPAPRIHDGGQTKEYGPMPRITTAKPTDV